MKSKVWGDGIVLQQERHREMQTNPEFIVLLARKFKLQQKTEPILG